MRHSLRLAGVSAALLALASCAGGPRFADLFDESAAAEGTGIQGAAFVRALVILAKHQATAGQRATAERNAARAVAAIQRRIAAENSAPPQARKKKTTMPSRIVVRTTRDSKTAPQAEAAVMIYDVRAQRIVGSEVYDIEKEPPPGELVKFETQVIRYVGVSGY